MLILKRKKNESILIDDTTTITIEDIGSDWVKISIDAPKDVSILRKELKEAANTNKEALHYSATSLDCLKKAFPK